MCHGGMLPADLASHDASPHDGQQDTTFHACTAGPAAHLQCHPSQRHRHGAPGSVPDQYEVGWGVPVLATMPVVHDRPQNSHTQGLGEDEQILESVNQGLHRPLLEGDRPHGGRARH